MTLHRLLETFDPRAAKPRGEAAVLTHPLFGGQLGELEMQQP